MTMTDPLTGAPEHGVFYKTRTARVEHDCNLSFGCVIHPGERYIDSVMPPWTMIRDDPEYPPFPNGEWSRSRYHADYHDHNSDGMIDLYHRTSKANAEAIRSTGRMFSREGGKVYFSNRRDGHAEGYGEAVIHIRVPRAWANLDDEFPNGEKHYHVLDTRVRPIWED